MRNDTTGVAPRDVANLARALKADHNALLRSVMTWSSWWIHGADVAPGVLRLPLLVDPAGQRILEVFSDEQAARDFAAREWGDAGPAPAHTPLRGGLPPRPGPARRPGFLLPHQLGRSS